MEAVTKRRPGEKISYLGLILVDFGPKSPTNLEVVPRLLNFFSHNFFCYVCWPQKILLLQSGKIYIWIHSTNIHLTTKITNTINQAVKFIFNAKKISEITHLKNIWKYFIMKIKRVLTVRGFVECHNLKRCNQEKHKVNMRLCQICLFINAFESELMHLLKNKHRCKEFKNLKIKAIALAFCSKAKIISFLKVSRLSLCLIQNHQPSGMS